MGCVLSALMHMHNTDNQSSRKN